MVTLNGINSGKKTKKVFKAVCPNFLTDALPLLHGYIEFNSKGQGGGKLKF